MNTETTQNTSTTEAPKKTAPRKNKGGRPSKAQIAAREGGVRWAKILLEEYSQGASDVEVCAELKLTEKEFDQRLIEDELFARLVQIGRMQAKAFWYKQGRLGLRDRTFNGKLYVDIMKNRFGWSERTENTERRPDDMKSEEELKQELDALMKRVQAAYGGDPNMKMYRELKVVQ